MTFEDYRDELGAPVQQVRQTVPISTDAVFGDVYSVADEAAGARFNELAPVSLVEDQDNFDAYDVYLKALKIARDAELTGKN